MKLKTIYLSVAAILASCTISAQSGAFLDIPADARSLAMGGTGTAVGGDAFSIFRNAAQTPFAAGRAEAAYTYMQWMPELSPDYEFHAAAAYYRIDDRQAVSAGFRYLGMPKSEIMDEHGTPGGWLRPKDMAVDVSYSRIIGRRLSAAVTAKYVYSDLGGDVDAGAVAFDAGVYYRGRFDIAGKGSVYMLGLQAANFGPDLDYAGNRQSLPWRLNFGAGINFELSRKHTLGVAADAGWRIRPTDSGALEGRFGAEYTYAGMASLRAGYHVGDKSKGGYDYGSLGLGVRVWRFSLGGAYLFGNSDCPLRNTWMLSLRFTPEWYRK